MREIIGVTLLGPGFGCGFKVDTKSADNKKEKIIHGLYKNSQFCVSKYTIKKVKKTDYLIINTLHHISNVSLVSRLCKKP